MSEGTARGASRPASALLEEARPLLVRRQLAEAVGLQEAIQLQQLHWLLDHYDSRSVTLDERQWLRADMKFWCAQFPWTSEATIRRTFDNLRSRHLIERNRGREASVYTINYEAVDALVGTAQIERSGLANRAERTAQDERSPSKGEGTARGSEETALAATSAADAGPQLFETPGAPAANADTPAAQLDEDSHTVWEHYATLFADRLRVKELTPPRKRTIQKALKAAGWTAEQRALAVELCMRAISGLKSYRAAHPDGSKDVNISVIFETGPHSKSNLTDQIQWWADQSESTVPVPGAAVRVPLDLVGVPSVSKGTIQARRREVGRMYDHPESPEARERGEAAVDWLKEHVGHKPKVVDGELRGWELC